MNKCNIPKKKTLVLSNSKFSQDTVIVYKKADEWYIDWQRMKTSDIKWQWLNEWQQMTVVQRMKRTHYASKNAILSVTKTNALLPGMGGFN